MTKQINKQEQQVLRTVQFRAREERWNHPTLCKLRSLGLVVAARIEGTTARYNWRISQAGADYFAENGQ